MVDALTQVQIAHFAEPRVTAENQMMVIFAYPAFYV